MRLAVSNFMLTMYVVKFCIDLEACNVKDKKVWQLNSNSLHEN